MSNDLPIGDPRQAGEEGPAGDQRPAGEEGPAGDPRPGGVARLGEQPDTEPVPVPAEAPEAPDAPAAKGKLSELRANPRLIKRTN